MPDYLIAPLLALAAVCLLLFVGAYLWWRRHASGRAPVLVAETSAEAPYDGGLPLFDRRSLAFADQSSAWQDALTAAGSRLAAGGVHSVFYAHGTFVGGDPLGIGSLLRGLHPVVGTRLATRATSLMRRGNMVVTKDLGNFTPAYLALCRAAFGPRIACYDFPWSSGNNHVARLESALALIGVLATAVTTSSDDGRQRLLLIGHSHAGQIFALVSQLVGKGPVADAVRAVVVEEGLMAKDVLTRARKTLARVGIDFVTLGTAPYYPWNLDRRHRLLHIVNAGDLIQRVGLAGSDLLALTARERRINRRLDASLGRGTSVHTWTASVRAGQRIAKDGFTYLVDFSRHPRGPRGASATFFGHGSYTRYEAMLSLHRLIASRFGSPP